MKPIEPPQLLPSN